MEHVEHNASSEMSGAAGDKKRSLYWKIFYVLTALTCFELAITFAPIPRMFITILVVVASMAKACFVGWFYMHLNHETKGLKVILMFPLFVAFFYAIFLITDAKFTNERHPSPYVGEPKRFFGPRNLREVRVDDFGNPIPEEIAIPQGSEHQAGAATSAGDGNLDNHGAPAKNAEASGTPGVPNTEPQQDAEPTKGDKH